MNTFIAVLFGAILGSLSKSIFEHIIPESLKSYLQAKRDLEFHFIRLYKEANKLRNDLIWHRNNVLKLKGATQTDNYYLNLAYTFYRFQAVRKIIDETMDENFIRLPKRLYRFENIDRLVSKSINSKNYFDFEGNGFEYSSLNTISKIRYEKVISFMIQPMNQTSRVGIMNIHDFESLIQNNQLVKSEYELLITFFKEMTEKTISFQRLHLIIEMLTLLKVNIDINTKRKLLIEGKGQSGSNKKELKDKDRTSLRDILEEKTYLEFLKDIEKLKITGNKIPFNYVSMQFNKT